MSGQLLPLPFFKDWDASSQPLAFGLVYTYAAGTANPQATYPDSTLTTPNTNPVVLNNRGEGEIWLIPGLAYKIIVNDQAGNQIRTVDNVSTISYTQQGLAELLWPQTPAEAASSVIPVNFSYLPYNALRYMTAAQSASVLARDLSQDVTAPLNAAFSIADVAIYLPAGSYLVTASLAIPACNEIYGDGVNSSIIQSSGALKVLSLSGSAVNYSIRDFGIKGDATANAVGLLWGDGALTSNGRMVNVSVTGFTGASAAAMKIDEMVTLLVENVILSGSTQNLITGISPNLPTTIQFVGGTIQLASSQGVYIQSCESMAFHGTVIESNTAQGVYAKTATGCVIQDLTFDAQCWFEDNYLNHIDTGTRVYALEIDGTVAAANMIVSNALFIQGGTLSDRKSIHIKGANASLTNARCFYGFAYDITVENSSGSSYVQMIGDAADRMARFTANLDNANILYPLYKPLQDLGNGLAELPTINLRSVVTYSTSMTFDAAAADIFVIATADTNAFTINAPTNPQTGRRITLEIYNNSGGSMGTITWNSVFKIASWSNPTNGNMIVMPLYYDSAHWRQAAASVTIAA